MARKYLQPIIMELKAKYEQRIEQAEAELRQVKNKILRISTLRVLLFAAGIIGTIYFYQAGTTTICLTIAVTFVPFLALVKYHNRLFFRKDWLETCIRVNSDELSALADNYEPFEDGKEFTNPAHRYSFDLDLFGRHSLFQALNRTCTSFGKEKLAEWLQKSSGDKGRDNPTAGGDKGTGCLFRFPGNIPDYRSALQRGDKRPRRN